MLLVSFPRSSDISFEGVCLGPLKFGSYLTYLSLVLAAIYSLPYLRYNLLNVLLVSFPRSSDISFEGVCLGLLKFDSILNYLSLLPGIHAVINYYFIIIITYSRVWFPFLVPLI